MRAHLAQAPQAEHLIPEHSEAQFLQIRGPSSESIYSITYNIRTPVLRSPNLILVSSVSAVFRPRWGTFPGKRLKSADKSSWKITKRDAGTLWRIFESAKLPPRSPAVFHRYWKERTWKIKSSIITFYNS